MASQYPERPYGMPAAPRGGRSGDRSDDLVSEIVDPLLRLRIISGKMVPAELAAVLAQRRGFLMDR